jgi:hypothetical protein
MCPLKMFYGYFLFMTWSWHLSVGFWGYPSNQKVSSLEKKHCFAPTCICVWKPYVTEQHYPRLPTLLSVTRSGRWSKYIYLGRSWWRNPSGWGVVSNHDQGVSLSTFTNINQLKIQSSASLSYKVSKSTHHYRWLQDFGVDKWHTQQK